MYWSTLYHGQSYWTTGRIYIYISYRIYIYENTYKLSGITSNISDIHIGNKKIYINKDGAFIEELILYPGKNTYHVLAKDRFGKEVKKDISVYYIEDKQKTL